MIIIIPAKMPGCAKKLVVRSSVLSMMSTSFPVGGWLSVAGLPVADELAPFVWSKSISFPSPPIPLSVSILGLSTKKCYWFREKPKSKHKWKIKKKKNLILN